MSGRTPPTAILLLAYGTPQSADEVEPYFTHIRGGRSPTREAVEHLKERYALVGGRTPLLDVSLALGRRLEETLNARGGNYEVFVAMKHWHPFIADVVQRIAERDILRVIVIVLAPHFSRVSIGGYKSAVRAAVTRLPIAPAVTFIDSWGTHPAFVRVFADLVRDGVAELGPSDTECMAALFSAHSLPLRIREWNDPYEAQLAVSCAAVAAGAKLSHWRFAWQSAGNTGEPWLGPDIVEYLETLSAEGIRRVLSVPIGFLCDHLEVLYDIDIAARRRATELGMQLHRIAMPNALPPLVHAIATLVGDVERGTLGTPLAD
ncbi:MAG: ferrochelatase [Gemmatimonadaceae bacterium]